ncbi:MAG: hypothetical protein Q8Q00_12860 [Dehalococcoidia bacterium]|nr:hypothetical protein [Dehalococcoidia bacterium]
MTSRTLVAIAIVALTAAAALAGHPLASRGLQAVTVGFDVDPGAAPANSATSLGSIEGCARVKNSAGNQFNIDVYVDKIPSGQDLAGFNYRLNFDDKRFRVVKENHELLLASAPGSNVLEFGGAGGGIPDVTSPHDVAPVDLGAPPASLEVGPMTGILGRYTLEVLQGAPDGVAELSLSSLGVFNSQGGEIHIDQAVAGHVALGSACRSDLPLPTSPPATEATPTPATAVLDADEDRVRDADDLCVDTPAGASVDASGCSDAQLTTLAQQAKELLLAAIAAGLNLTVSLDPVAIGGSTAVLAVFADENDEPVSGVDISFKIEEQPGSDADLDDKAQVTKTSDADGFAEATLNVGSTPGEIVVSATAEGQTETVTVTVAGAGEATPAPSPTAGGEPTPEDGSPTAGEEDDGGGNSPWPYVIGGIVVGLTALGGGLWWWRRRATRGL